MLKKIKYLLLIAPGMVLAQFAPPNPGSYNTPDATVDGVLKSGLNFLFWAVGLVSLVMLVVGAFTYITSQGNDEAVGKAKNIVLYSIIGVVVALLSIVILSYISGTLLADNATPPAL